MVSVGGVCVAEEFDDDVVMGKFAEDAGDSGGDVVGGELFEGGPLGIVEFLADGGGGELVEFTFHSEDVVEPSDFDFWGEVRLLGAKDGAVIFLQFGAFGVDEGLLGLVLHLLNAEHGSVLLSKARGVRLKGRSFAGKRPFSNSPKKKETVTYSTFVLPF